MLGMDFGKNGKVVMVTKDGREIPLDRVTTEIEIDATEWESPPEGISRIPYEGTLTVTGFGMNYKKTLSWKHRDKFKIIRLGGKMI